MFPLRKSPRALRNIFPSGIQLIRSNSNVLTQRTREVYVPNIEASFPYRWLRDSCQCSKCIHPTNLQKLHRTSDIPIDVVPGEVLVAGHELHITWPESAADPQHQSVYSLEWLKNYTSAESRRSFHHDVDQVTWTPSQLRNARHLFMDYSQLHGHDVLHAINQLTRYGVLFIKGVPNSITDDQGCEVRRLAAKFGRIRDTFYGEVWNVRNVKNSTNIAYTNLDLGLHMDLQYYQHPPRYQMLHSIRNRVQGGTSIFLDAIHAANKLYTSSPSAFNILARTPVPYHYINDGHHLHHSHPVISLSPFTTPDRPETAPPAIDCINYSPPFQAPLPIDTPDEFYGALKQFADLLDKDRFEYLMKEGDAVLFDNRRVFHARTEFREIGDTPEGETSRWLKGCYLEADDVLDRARILRERVEAGQ